MTETSTLIDAGPPLIEPGTCSATDSGRSPPTVAHATSVQQRQRLCATGSITSGAQSTAGSASAGSVLRTLEQSGGAKIRLPRSEPGALSAVLLNTAGGLTGGDQMHWHAGAEAGSRLTLATAASEKIYRTHGPAARQHTTLEIGSGARLDWLPQETILFDGARLERTLEARLARDATLLMVEAIAFGRQASGESLRTLGVHDRWRIYREDRLLHAEAFQLREGGDHQLAGTVARRRGTLHDAGAMATVLLCSPAPTESLTTIAARLNDNIDQLSTSASSSTGPRSAVRSTARDTARATAPDTAPASTIARASPQASSSANSRAPSPAPSQSSSRAHPPAHSPAHSLAPSPAHSGVRIEARSNRAWSTGAASALDGRLVIRLVAQSGHELRRILLPCLETLQGDASLPRVWYV